MAVAHAAIHRGVVGRGDVRDAVLVALDVERGLVKDQATHDFAVLPCIKLRDTDPRRSSGST